MEPLTRRATSHYRKATPDQIVKGHAWYEEAHAVARVQAEVHDVTIEVAAGVLAALSPRLGWGPNVQIAERVLHSGGTLTRGALTRSLDQANRIYAGTAAKDVLRGPKTRAFYDAILTAGHSPDPVIDRHAWDMLTGKRGAPSPTPAQYRRAAQLMVRAGTILNVGHHEVQATTWIVQRALYWTEGAFQQVT